MGYYIIPKPNKVVLDESLIPPDETFNKIDSFETKEEWIENHNPLPIDVVVKSKEEWLEEHGALVTEEAFKSIQYDTLNNCLPVCLLDNGFFTAAGIAFSAQERDVFDNPMDIRPKKYYLCNIDELLEVSDLNVNAISEDVKYERCKI